jgi:hypothetical protein
MANSTETGSSAGSDIATAVAPISKALKTDAGAIAGEAKSVLGQVSDEAGAQISQLADQAKAQVSVATDKVKGVAAEQKDLLAAQVGGVADAMQRVAADLEASGGASAPYARMIADNAKQLSSTIRDNDVDQIMAKAQDFGRHQPVAFMGAAALLGFAASRFLMASANRSAQSAVTPQPNTATAPATNYQPNNGATNPSTSYQPGRA